VRAEQLQLSQDRVATLAVHRQSVFGHALVFSRQPQVPSCTNVVR
jgi:hypothetical protein